jgi:hypothetical protein
MKTLIFLAFLLPITGFAQTETDYQKVMAKFQQFYNAGHGDSIYAMFKSSIQSASVGHPLWTKESNATALKQYGTLKSFNFLGIDNTDAAGVYVFQTFFSKAGAKTTSLTLDDNYRLGTFRFITKSEGIDALLKKRKASR